MAILSRPDVALHMECIDLVPPWNAPGEAVLFCHGVAADADIWSGWLPGLVDRFRIARFDTRGFGRSAVREAGADWSFDGLADDIMAVAGEAGFGRFHLVGESLGGTACLFTAAREGGRILSVTACSTGHYGPSIRNVQEWRALVGAEGMTRWSETMMGHRFADGAVSRPQWDWFHRVQCATSAEALLAAADLLTGADLSGVFAGVSCPVLLLHPDSSPFLPVGVSADLLELLPDARLRVFPAARHGIALSHAAEASGAFRAFAEGMSAPE